MPDLPLSVEDFLGAYAALNGNRLVKATKRRCLKASCSFGIQYMAAAAPTPAHAIQLAAYKALAVKLAMEFTGAQLQRPQPYTQLDSTEKTNISFWTGMTVATLVADQVLGIAQLYHAGSLKQRGLINTNQKTKSLADLIGQDKATNWHVLEAKARQDTPSAQRRQEWKNQAQTIRLIDGIAPATRSVCYTKVAQTYSAGLSDPPADQELGHLEIEFARPPNELLKSYYDPLIQSLVRPLLPENGATPVEVEREGHNILMSPILYDVVDQELVYLGILEETITALTSGDLLFSVEEVETENFFLASDGISILTSRDIVRR